MDKRRDEDHLMIHFPTRLVRAAAENEEIAAWLSVLPEVIQEQLCIRNCSEWEQVASDWSITIRASSNQGDIYYLKACPPNLETTSAICCLLSNHHPQLVHCLEADVSSGIHVLANVPGTPFSPDDNEERHLAEVGGLLKALQSLIPDARMIRLASWCSDLLTVADFYPATITANISRCAALLDSTPTSVWLHGDLHHANIIRSDNSGLLVAIDPKGIYGDASFDICTFIRNHVPPDLDDISLKRFLEHRIRLIAEAAGYPLERAFAWAAAGNALSLVWDLPKSGVLLTNDHHHMNRILTHLNALAKDNDMH